jgi:hypothetical protein
MRRLCLHANEQIRTSLGRALIASSLAAASSIAYAAPVNFSFSCTSDTTGVCAAVAPQMNVAVEQVNPATVSFTFTNNGSRISSVTDILWDSSLLSGISILAQTNVIFGLASPPLGVILNGGAQVPPFVADFAVTAPLRRGGQTGGTGSTPVENGIRSDEPGDTLVVHGALASGVTYDAFLASMQSPINGSTRIGLGVNDIQSTSTPSLLDSMITVPSAAAPVIPVPGALPLMVSGLFALGIGWRRRTPG